MLARAAELPSARDARTVADHDDPPGRDIVIGSGDDAAVIDTAGPTVISVDTAVEGRHFRLDWSAPHQIGARAVVQGAADIAAMGARTTGVVVSIACPPTTLVGTVLDLDAGIVAATHRLGARVLGGDLVAAEQLVVSVTAVGRLDGIAPIVVGGAQVGDELAVSGPLGGCAAGLAVLRAVESGGDRALLDRYARLVEAYRLPDPDLAQGVAAARCGAHALTDISDGLIEELRTLAAASRVRVEIDSDRLPRVGSLAAAARDLDVDLREWTLAGGEDHELLGAFPSGTIPPGWTVIGAVTHSDTSGSVIVDGTAAGALRGWQSFADIEPDGRRR
ncbi:thiamine-monophosphate kinase [Gordonia soli NBRC 108243]|uniref:Thiamine-monophosphate kinase n=1 Tax=Gordonia soli NBRC 108243 TaxID=1223545 RepID=M0QCG8_9ACTN|nr:thiamine-monophosphate kinase [Gordonia soli NBRC 108243]